VELCLVGEATEGIIMCNFIWEERQQKQYYFGGISDNKSNRISNNVGFYLIEQATGIVIMWGYI